VKGVKGAKGVKGCEGCEECEGWCCAMQGGRQKSVEEKNE